MMWDSTRLSYRPPHSRPLEGSKIPLVQIGDLHQRFEQPDFQWMVAVHRDDDSFATALHDENMVAALDTG